MKYFIGIVPPEHIYQTVLAIQERFGDNRLEPHITLRAPVTVTNLTAWTAAIENVCKTFSPIHIALPTTGNFGKRVLFIDVQSLQLNELHHIIVPAIKPFEQADQQQHETPDFHPHLTLGRSWCGFTPTDFAAMKTLANDYLSQTPISFSATFVRIYHKPSGKGRYETLKDVMLSG